MPARTTDVAIPALRFWRLHRGLTQEALARQADMTVRAVGLIEHTGRTTARTASKLARVLDITVALLQEEPQP